MRLETLDKLSRIRLLRPLTVDPEIFDKIFKICILVLLAFFVGFYRFSSDNQRYSFLKHEKNLYILDTKTADLYVSNLETAFAPRKPVWGKANPFKAKVFEIPTDSLTANDKNP